MADTAPVTARVRVQVASSGAAGYAVVLVSEPAKDDYRFVVPTRHVRAIVNALHGEIAAHPDVYPTTETRRLDLAPARQRR